MALLVPSGTPVYLPGTDQFSVRKGFCEAAVGGFKIAPLKLKLNFLDNFADVVEYDVPGVTLQGYDTTERAYDTTIAYDLPEAEVRFAYMLMLMDLQRHGEDGALATNKLPNLFFKKNKEGTRFTVSLTWFELTKAQHEDIGRHSARVDDCHWVIAARPRSLLGHRSVGTRTFVPVKTR